MAIAALILGIASIFCCWMGYGAILGAILAILGIVFAGKNADENKAGMAKTGKVLSVIGLLLNLIGFIACTLILGGLGVAGAMYGY